MTLLILKKYNIYKNISLNKLPMFMTSSKRLSDVDLVSIGFWQYISIVDILSGT